MSKRKGGKSSKAKGNKNAGGGFLIVFFSIFLLAGLAFLYFAFIIPAMKSMSSSDWPQVPCKIISSSVGSHRGDDSTTYSVDITFQYEFNGKTYKSDTYDFMDMSSSGRKGKARIVSKYPAGSTANCFVNPDAPGEAVLTRELGNDMFFALIPLIFVIVGGGGIWFGIRTILRPESGISEMGISRSRDGSVKQVETDDYLPDLPKQTVDGIELKATQKPLGVFIFCFLFTAFWNGFIGVFVYQTFSNFGTNAFQWIQAIFLIPFVLVGLVMLVFTVYQFLALFNPWPDVHVDKPYIMLGESFELEWEFSGRVNRLNAVEVLLISEVSATYKSGKNNTTRTEEVYEERIFKSDDTRDITTGMIEVTVPDNLMHSLELKHNKVKWKIQIKGDIPKWPDVDATFEIVVVPHGWEPGI